MGTLKDIGAQVGDKVICGDAKWTEGVITAITTDGRYCIESTHNNRADPYRDPYGSPYRDRIIHGLEGAWEITSKDKRVDRAIPVQVPEGKDAAFQVMNAALSRPADTPDPDAPIGALVGLALTQAVEACTLTKKGNYPDAMTSILKAIQTLSEVAVKIDRRGHAAEDQGD